jgi:hypothetical protein
MFKVSAGQGEIDAEDAAYWNVEIAEDELEVSVPDVDPVIQTAIELGGVLVETQAPIFPAKPVFSQDNGRLTRYVGRYLDTVHLIHDEAKRAKLQAKLLVALTDGVQDDEGTYSVVGLRDPDFMQYPVHAEKLTRYVRGWLKQQHFVFAGCEDEVAAKVVDLAQQALGLKPIQLDVFQALQEAHDAELQEQISTQMHGELAAEPTPKRRRKLDLLAVPDTTPEASAPQRPLASTRKQDEREPVQLAMF